MNSEGLSKFVLLSFLCIVAYLSGCSDPSIGQQVKERFRQRGKDARVASAQADIVANIPSALYIYQFDNGAYPSTGEGLAALMQAPASAHDWKGPYLPGKIVDPWGNDYKYEYPGTHGGTYDLYSLGPDGLQSIDDIGNWMFDKYVPPNESGKSRNMYVQESAKDVLDRGIQYAKEGRLEESIIEFTKVLELNHNDSEAYEAYTQRGMGYFGLGKDELAFSDYNKAIEVNPHDIFAYVFRGASYFKRGNYDEAIADFSKAIEIDPSHAPSYNNRAIAYYYKQDYAKAWDDLHKVEELGFKVTPDLLEQLKKSSGREN